VCGSCCGTRSCQSPPDILRELASAPRPTGSDAIAAARERCARDLRALGFQVRERPFEFSEFAGRFATPLLGGAAAIIVGVAGSLGVGGMRFGPLVVVVAGGLAVAVAGRWLLERGVLAAPLLRQRGTNLEAVRENETPSIWLCAHLDTKSQPVPTLVRTVGIILESIGFLLIAALALAAAAGATLPALYWALGAAVTLAGAIPVVLCVVSSRSPGALDNASGVATVISAAREVQDQRGVGVLITDAEELGLAGARAWARAQPTTTVLNCDGVDDVGPIQVMYSGGRPEAVLQSIARASRASGVDHNPRRLALGILTDSVAFTNAGIPSVTFSRGTLRSLARVHSRRDSLARLKGSGIADTAKLMAAAARELATERNV
jgi:hypothetical protein